MLSISQKPQLYALIEQRERQRNIQRLARAVAQSLRLNMNNPDLVLGPHLGQPMQLKNHEALEQWVEETLEKYDLPTSSQAIEPLCRQLVQCFEEIN